MNSAHVEAAEESGFPLYAVTMPMREQSTQH